VANAVLETLDEPTALRLKGLPSIRSRVITQEMKDGKDRQGTQGRCEADRTMVAGVGSKNDGDNPKDRSQLRNSGKQAEHDSSGDVLTILCRTNACAVANLLQAMTAGQRPFLVGGGADVVKFVEAAQSLKEGRGTSHPELACFANWGEVEAYAKEDEGEDLRLMVGLIKEFGCRAILDALRRMPEESQADFVISTCHKSKGREWPHVRLAADFPTLSKAGDPEKKLIYVAVTRAKLTLDVSGCPFFVGQDAIDVSNLEEAKDAAAKTTNGQDANGHVRERDQAGGPGLRGSGETSEASGQAGEDVQQCPEAGKETVAHGPRPCRAPAPLTAPTQYTWVKSDAGEWLVEGPKGGSGSVEVFRRDRSSSRKTLGRVVWGNGISAIYSVD
jgi:hypothetical protein